jgi:hypothetical protein
MVIFSYSIVKFPQSACGMRKFVLSGYPRPELFKNFRGGITPQLFQSIEATRILGKDMHDDVKVVQDDPGGAGFTFAVMGTDTLFPQTVFNSVGNRPHMNIDRTGTDHEEVTDRGYLFHFEDSNVEAFFG